MAASIAVEEDRGTYTRSPYHSHNGYYAGDFDRHPVTRPVARHPVLSLPRS